MDADRHLCCNPLKVTTLHVLRRVNVTLYVRHIGNWRHNIKEMRKKRCVNISGLLDSGWCNEDSAAVHILHYSLDSLRLNVILTEAKSCSLCGIKYIFGNNSNPYMRVKTTVCAYLQNAMVYPELSVGYNRRGDIVIQVVIHGSNTGFWQTRKHTRMFQLNASIKV